LLQPNKNKQSKDFRQIGFAISYICNSKTPIRRLNVKPHNTFDVTTKQTTLKNFNIMKSLFTPSKFIVASLFTLAATFANAQSASTGLIDKTEMKQDSVNSFISFSPVYLDGKTYVRWLVKNDKKDGVFVVERSADGLDFEALGFKDRVGTQLLVNLFYSFIDQEPLAGENHYRIMQVGADNTYRYSSVVKVINTGSPIQGGSAASAEGEKK
jgi:hypothetical protein